MDTGPPRLQRRNVQVYDSDGAIVAGFWQHGTLQWDEFYRYLTSIVTTAGWTLFQYDPTEQQRGVPCPPGVQIVQPGHYILLSTSGEPIRVDLVPTLARPRNPTLSATPTRWIRKGCPSKITDTVDAALMGGSIKIDSLQNVITLRCELHDAWDNYEFGVNPNDNYRITAFTNGNADINGLHLQLDHIQDPTLRPLDELFTDHFMQGIFKHVKGAGEQIWTYEDCDDVFGDGSNLSNLRLWQSSEGKELFELALADRLFDRRISQQDAPM